MRRGKEPPTVLVDPSVLVVEWSSKVAVELLELREIAEGLEAASRSDAVQRPERVLRVGGADPGAVDGVERILGARLPRDFRELITAYDFGRLYFCPIMFCVTGDYLAHVVRMNTAVRWWGEGQRPSHLVRVAVGDPFDALLETAGGAVLALDPEVGLREWPVAARSFTDFFRGLGTLALTQGRADDKKGFARELAGLVGASSERFWWNVMDS